MPVWGLLDFLSQLEKLIHPLAVEELPSLLVYMVWVSMNWQHEADGADLEFFFTSQRNLDLLVPFIIQDRSVEYSPESLHVLLPNVLLHALPILSQDIGLRVLLKDVLLEGVDAVQLLCTDSAVVGTLVLGHNVSNLSLMRPLQMLC